jgi:hypothetical protein
MAFAGFPYLLDVLLDIGSTFNVLSILDISKDNAPDATF